ncbi:hypothetical protein OC834_001126 [Tilletia horrida]|nr:hypothetical protein OC834_001126 [Tilletia horrida]
MASPQQQQHAQGPGAGGDGDPWDPQQRTLRADPYHHQQPQQPPSAAEYTTSYGGAGVFQATSPPAAGQGRMPAPIRSGRASPTSDQPRPVGPRPSSSGNGAAVDHHHHLPGGGGSSSQGRSHVQIQQQLPNPRAGRAHNPQSLSNASAPFETTFAYPPNYPAGANAFATAGKDSTSVADSERQPAHQQASGSAFSRKRPNAQTYKSNSSAEWARLLGRAGYAAAPQQDDGTQDPNWPGQSQLIRGPGTKASPTNFLCLPITTEAVRKFIMILTIAAILWVPGIVALTAYNAGPHNNYSRPRVWKVGIFWWSVWLSSIWVGWFVAEAVANLVPRLLGGTVGAFSMEIKHYLQYLKVLAKFIALFAWTILKFLIQVIALSFHRVSYEDRLAQNKLHVEILTTLYDHALRSGVVSSAASSRPGTPTKGFYSSVKTDGSKSLGGITKGRRSLFDYERPHLMRRANRSKSDESGINNSIMGYVASELGTENDLAARDFRLRFKNGVPLPTKASPRTAVIVALSSANETRKLSYRIFRTFSHWEPVEEGTDEVERVMVFSDISRFFSTAAAARVAWELLDKDYNGSVTEEEMLAAGQEVHRERDALMSSMRDIDSAVGRLDQVFMSFFSIISVVIVAGLISIKFSSLVTSFGTVLLGLSWLLSATAQEALSAIIFLFVKHPYDVGDRVEVDGGGGVATYVVAEIQLLSTIFKTTTGKYVQISHSVLTTKMVTNLRRSGPIEETITFDVPYSTTFEQIEQLRERMMEWIAQQPRDFFPGLNIAIIDLPEFKSMTLQCPIRYKSNWQAGGIKTMRKNRWMCRFKEILSETGIALPDAPSTTRVTMIPYPPPESETAKPTAAEALASTRGGSGEAREYNFLDDADAHDAKVLNTRIVRQRADEGFTSGAGLAASRPGSAGLQQQLQQAGGEMRRRPLNGDEAA